MILILCFVAAPLLLSVAPSEAALFVQCPGDLNGDLKPDPFLLDENGNPTTVPNPDYASNVVCMHISGGDGFAKMGDGSDQYALGFGLVNPQTPLNRTMVAQQLKARFPAPTIILEEGQELYLTMTNVGMTMRPDLFDPHSIHWHGFPNAAPMFDGLPEPSITANMGASFTYYYNAAVPGTYFYHCHVEASEHMQMGMIGNLWVKPQQDGTSIRHGGRTFTKFAYNDGNGSTGYDRMYPVQLTGFDSNFHAKSLAIQALPFAAMYDNYPMINGRGYPHTINTADTTTHANQRILNSEGFWAQRLDSLITAKSGQRILLRVSNVSTTHLYTLATTLGVPMKVVGRGAALLRGPTGQDTSFEVSTLNIGGGQAYDVIVDTQGVPAGTYFLYATDLSNLSNGDQERGGIMTEIVIN
jgi:FtsP/CotA-like multicopper oxidase with cupredoxin domain